MAQPSPHVVAGERPKRHENPEEIFREESWAMGIQMMWKNRKASTLPQTTMGGM